LNAAGRSIQFNRPIEGDGPPARGKSIGMRAHAALLFQALGAGIVAVSFGSIFARIAGAPAPTVAALRMVFSAMILAPFVLASGSARREMTRFSGAELRLFAVAGLFLALHFFLWIASLSYTGVTSSVVFVTTNPLWVALYTAIVLRKRISGVFWIGLAVAMLGGGIIGGRDAWAGGMRWRGDLLALGGAVAFAGYFIVGARLRGRISLLAYVFPVYACAGVLLSAAAVVSGASFVGYGWKCYAVCFAMALVCQVVGHSLFNWALKHLETTVVAVAALGEPVGASVLALIILRERPMASEIVGGVAILAGIYLVMRMSPEAARANEGAASGS
jgi:drug/metabolite transporter (DMT)-like permease